MTNNISTILPPNASIRDYCQFIRRIEPKQLDAIRNNGTGLDTPDLEESLKNGEYKPVLNAIWSARDRVRCLKWLREHESQLHAPLLCEQAIEEFLADPALGTVLLQSIPRLRAAQFREMQDGKCIKNTSNHVMGLISTYWVVLREAVQTEINQDLDDFHIRNDGEIQAASMYKIRIAAKQSLYTALPHPKWALQNTPVGVAKNPHQQHSIQIPIMQHLIQIPVVNVFSPQELQPDISHKQIRDLVATRTLEVLTHTANPEFGDVREAISNLQIQ